METSLHRQLKLMYAQEAGKVEAVVAGYRIDALEPGTGRLIEIQAASLSGIRKKLKVLLDAGQSVLLVKPLAARRQITYLDRRDGEILRRRLSPLRQNLFHLFQEFVHLRELFPHPLLTVEVLLTAQEELRAPGKHWRRKHDVIDRCLGEVLSRTALQTPADLLKLLPPELEQEFTTAELATRAAIPRWLAQKVAYCLRHMQAAESLGKRGRAQLYRLLPGKQKAAPVKTPRKRRAA